MTKENIIIAALRLFILRGYKYVALIDVANETGVSKGGIYHYFSGKEELLGVSTQYLLHWLEDKYKELAEDTESLQDMLRALLVEQRLEGWINDMLGIQGDLRANFARLILETIDNFPEIQVRVDSNRKVICGIIEERIRLAAGSGEIRDDLDSQAMAALIFSILRGQRCAGTEFNTPQLRNLMMENLWTLIRKG